MNSLLRLAMLAAATLIAAACYAKPPYTSAYGGLLREAALHFMGLGSDGSPRRFAPRDDDMKNAQQA